MYLHFVSHKHLAEKAKYRLKEEGAHCNGNLEQCHDENNSFTIAVTVPSQPSATLSSQPSATL